MRTLDGIDDKHKVGEIGQLISLDDILIGSMLKDAFVIILKVENKAVLNLTKFSKPGLQDC